MGYKALERARVQGIGKVYDVRVTWAYVDINLSQKSHKQNHNELLSSLLISITLNRVELSEVENS